jgi:hypothetical protein
MCTGISLGWSFIPTELKGKKSLRRRVYHRDGKREVWFLYDDREPKLPIRRDGQLQLVRWGNGRGQSRHLPRTGWTWQSTVESGYWSQIGAILVDIPVTFAYDRGVWVHVRQGIRGLLVPDEKGRAVCFMICEPASHYYQIMTRNDRMPVFIGGEF